MLARAKTFNGRRRRRRSYILNENVPSTAQSHLRTEKEEGEREVNSDVFWSALLICIPFALLFL